MKKKTTLSLAGAAFAAASSFAPLASAADNPFGMTKLDSGYQLAQADKKADGKCGEGKCGGAMKAESKKKDGKCGEGKCGTSMSGDKKPADDKKKDGSCGGKKQDGACGGKK